MVLRTPYEQEKLLCRKVTPRTVCGEGSDHMLLGHCISCARLQASSRSLRSLARFSVDRFDSCRS